MRRFTILSLMLCVSVFAIGIAALRYPSALWANAVFSLALAACTIALLTATCGRGSRRAFAIGFAVCGWAYVTFALGPWFDVNVAPKLITSTLLELSYETIIVPASAPSGAGMAAAGFGNMASSSMGGPGMGPGGMASSGGGSVGVGQGGSPMSAAPAPSRWELWNTVDRTNPLTKLPNFWLEASPSYLRVGHSLFALLFGFLGGLLTRSLRAEARPNAAATT